jgi:hypothetical protein
MATHEIVLHVAPDALRSAAPSTTTQGKWSVSFGPIFMFAEHLQTRCEEVPAPSHLGYVSFSFENLDGTRWADHEDLDLAASEMWRTHFEWKGQLKPAMPERKAWLASKAWVTCKRSCAKHHHPDLFAYMATVEDLKVLRPPGWMRAIELLFHEFGNPRIVRFTYETRLDVV